MKVYTKTGDKGMTSLIGGERVFKTDSRVEAYGTVDELSAFVALLTDRLRKEAGTGELTDDLNRIQSRLMMVEALLAAGEAGSDKVAPLLPECTGWLEQRIDAMQEALPAISRAVTKPFRCVMSAGRYAAGPNAQPCVPTRNTA